MACGLFVRRSTGRTVGSTSSTRWRAFVCISIASDDKLVAEAMRGTAASGIKPG
jgi:hypothetical protein